MEHLNDKIKQSSKNKEVVVDRNTKTSSYAI